MQKLLSVCQKSANVRKINSRKRTHHRRAKERYPMFVVIFMKYIFDHKSSFSIASAMSLRQWWRLSVRIMFLLFWSNTWSFSMISYPGIPIRKTSFVDSSLLLKVYSDLIFCKILLSTFSCSVTTLSGPLKFLMVSLKLVNSSIEGPLLSWFLTITLLRAF